MCKTGNGCALIRSGMLPDLISFKCPCVESSGRDSSKSPDGVIVPDITSQSSDSGHKLSPVSQGDKKPGRDVLFGEE